MPIRKGRERTLYHREWHRQRAERLQALKSGKPCADCGVVYDPVCMDWDHLENKLFQIGKMATRNWDKVLAEIAKCELVCANCHRLRTKNRLVGVSSNGTRPGSYTAEMQVQLLMPLP